MVCNGKTKQHRQIRCSGVPGCSGVPVFRSVPGFLVLVHAVGGVPLSGAALVMTLLSSAAIVGSENLDKKIRKHEKKLSLSLNRRI